MLGTSSNPGIIPRVINGIFEKIAEDKKTEGDEWTYKVTFSFLEIYNEKVCFLYYEVVCRLSNKSKYFVLQHVTQLQLESNKFYVLFRLVCLNGV